MHIHGHVYELPAGPIGTLLTVADDPVLELPGAAELLDVQQQEIRSSGLTNSWRTITGADSSSAKQ